MSITAFAAMNLLLAAGIFREPLTRSMRPFLSCFACSFSLRIWNPNPVRPALMDVGVSSLKDTGTVTVTFGIGMNGSRVVANAAMMRPSATPNRIKPRTTLMNDATDHLPMLRMKNLARLIVIR
jgi:hypothetical protein